MKAMTNNQDTITKQENAKTGGFTIIETLVAITVLMIAVAGPLVVASKGLTAALYARDQVIASYLAQESMEVLKNVRDNNLNSESDTPVDWLDRIAGADSSGQGRNCTAEFPCDASALTGLIACGSDSCPIGFFAGAGYVNGTVTGANDTIFSREYYVTKPNDASAPCALDAVECEAHVVVTWNEGTVPYEVDLNSELVKNLR